MWIFLILVGMVAAGIVADFVVENHLTTAPDQAFMLFRHSFELSTPKLVLAAAVLGILAILFLGFGLGLLRGSWGRRRGLKRGLKALEEENTELKAKLHLATAVTAVPHEEPVAERIEGVSGPQ
ncbi:MAG TPA: hypothetical protein VEQ37_14580 [Actinomycetota bacterium]|nr:hypothetical protein [Actinomycetota bacterium]